MAKSEQLPPRPGTLQDRLVQKHGKVLGGNIFFKSIIGGLTLTMLFFLTIIGFCAFIVINSAYNISPVIGNISVLIAIVCFVGVIIFLYRAEPLDFVEFLERYFSLQLRLVLWLLLKPFSG